MCLHFLALGAISSDPRRESRHVMESRASMNFPTPADSASTRTSVVVSSDIAMDRRNAGLTRDGVPIAFRARLSAGSDGGRDYETEDRP
jgi:hypothetical protein